MVANGYFVHNPATGETESSRDFDSDDEIRTKLERSAAAYERWRQVPLAERASALAKLAEGLRAESKQLAHILAREVGKPLDQGEFEVELAASIASHYASNAEKLLAPNPIEVSGAERVEVHYLPVGGLLGIMPWNFPFYQFLRFVAPNVLLGNTVVLKPAPQCPESAEAFGRIADAAGLEGVVQITYASVPQVEQIIASPAIRGVSLTGSDRAGRAVAEIAGKNLKKVVLELGGSDPFIVLSDADLDAAVAQAVGGRFFNGGQACNSAKRTIVEAEVYPAFLEKFADAVAQLRVGDPLEAGVAVGPVASEAAQRTLMEQISDATDRGAKLLVGGDAGREGPGYWVTPTVLTDVQPGMRSYHEEVFGPVATVYRAENEDDAIRIANDCDYGLGASVHSSNIERALSVGARVNSGMLFINEATATSAEMPFGGIGRSGFGRELGVQGVREFANERLVRIK